MSGKMILKIVFLVLFILLAAAYFVIGMFIGKSDKNSAGSRNMRILMRIRVGCFLAMLISLLLIVVIT